MIWLLCSVLWILTSPFKSKIRLEAENAVLRHRLIVLRRKMPGRPWLTNNDRWFLLQMYRWFPSILKVARIIQPETPMCWHRASFRFYWRWKSLGRGGRPLIETELRALIRRMSIENPLWGAPRIHGELLKLGLAVVPPSRQACADPARSLTILFRRRNHLFRRRNQRTFIEVRRCGRRNAAMLPSRTRPVFVCGQPLERKSVAKVFKHELLELLRHHHSGVADGKRGLF